MRLLDRYIYSHVIRSTFLVLLVLMGIESFMELVHELSDIGVGNYGLVEAFIYVPLQLPKDLYELFPMIGFLGCLLGLGRLASSSELIVMRAAGISIFQISKAVLKASILMILVVTLMGEWMSPKFESQAANLKAIAMGKEKEGGKLRGIWLHQGGSYINIGSVTDAMILRNITQFDFNKKNQLIRIVHANYGEKKNKGWEFYSVKETFLTPHKTHSKMLATKLSHMRFESQLLQESDEAYDQENLYTLFHNILYRKHSGLVTGEYQYAFWKRLVQPLTTLVMICLGIPFIFGSLRSSSTGFRVMMGVMIGFGFYMLNQFFGPIILVYQFSPILAAALPTVLIGLVYVILLRWIV